MPAHHLLGDVEDLGLLVAGNAREHGAPDEQMVAECSAHITESGIDLPVVNGWRWGTPE